MIKKDSNQNSKNNSNCSKESTLINETETYEKMTENDESNRSQQGTLREESIVTTERISNNAYNMIASICGKKREDNEEKSLSDNLTEYFKSNELKTALKHIGYNKENAQKIVKKLQEYLGKYNSGEKTLDWLKKKFAGYFAACKKTCKENIEKDPTVIEKFDTIEKAITFLIMGDEQNSNTTDAYTFREHYNLENYEDDEQNKSYLEIPQLNISAINSPHGSQNTNNSNKTTPKIGSFNNPNKGEEYKKMEVNRDGNINITTELNKQTDDSDKYKIEILINIYEKTFGHKFSPAVKNLIIDLVLETEEYIKKVIASVNKYKIQNSDEKKILEAIAKSTSKNNVDKIIRDLEKAEGFTIETPHKQADNKILKIPYELCKKAYNNYFVYSNLSKKQIDKIAEYAYIRLHETEEDKIKREEYNNKEKKKLLGNNDDHLLNTQPNDDMKKMEEFVRTKGYTVEDLKIVDFQAIAQHLEEETQHLKEEIIDESNYYNYCNTTYCCYTLTVTVIMMAIQVISYDNDVSYHGFGPSGF